jgi:hypothetical protein
MSAVNPGIERCSRCVLPGNYPGISFDSAGLCSVCSGYLKTRGGMDWKARERRLEAILGRYRGRNSSKYDCLVPFSGGKDSSYTLYLMVRKYGMTPLALNVDNGFTSPAARGFITDFTGRLGVDLEVYKPPEDLMKRVYRHAMEKTGEFCNACVVLIPTAINRTAWERGIRLVVGSFCRMTEQPPAEMANMDGKRFWNIMKDAFTRSELEHDYFFPFWKRLTGIRYIDLPDFIFWDVPEIHRTLAARAGFERRVTELRSDCRATPFSNFLFNRVAGYSKMDFLLSGMVRCGFLERDEAVRMLAEFDPASPPEGFFEFMQGIGCPPDILEKTEGLSASDYRGRDPLLRRAARSLGRHVR